MKITSNKAKSAGIRLQATFPGIACSDGSIIDVDGSSVSPLIQTDESRLMQVILNLQSNAIKFT